MKRFCEVHKVKIERGFDEEEAGKIAVIDMSIPQRPLLLAATFAYPAAAYQHLKEINRHPSNYRVLNFKTGKEYSLLFASKPEVKGDFDPQRDADMVFE